MVVDEEASTKTACGRLGPKVLILLLLTSLHCLSVSFPTGRHTFNGKATILDKINVKRRPPFPPNQGWENAWRVYALRAASFLFFGGAGRGLGVYYFILFCPIL